MSSLVLNVRQVSQYPVRTAVSPSDVALLQVGGLGGGYWQAQLGTLVGTVFANGGAMGIGVPVPPGATNGLYASTITLLPSPVALSFGPASFGCDPSGKFSWQLGTSAALATLDGGGNLSVSGQVASCLGVLAPLANPQFQGIPTAPTANLNQTDSQIANTCWVQLLLQQRIQNVAPLGSPAFWGIPTAPTAANPLQADTQIANTCFVQLAIQAAFGSYVAATSICNSFNGRTGNVCLNLQDVMEAGGAPINSPRFQGIPCAPTPPDGDASSQIATTYWVTQAVEPLVTDAINGTYATLDSPQFTGNPTAPTAPVGTNDGQIATTAYVLNAVAHATAGVSSFNGRTGIVTLTAADVTNAGGAPITSPALAGIPTAPTAATGTNSTQIATTAYVMAALTGSAGVESFNGRSGVVTLTTADVTGAGGAPSTSPTFGGVPTAPTAAPSTNSAQIATTAFVTAAVNAAITGSVTSFNGRQGAVTLIANDLSAAGGALLAGPSFTGNPTAPTQTAGTSNTTLATTAFVMAAVSAATAGVSSWNGRTGAVTLTLADVTTVGGAPSASPNLTGVPTAPTALPATNNTQIATTQYVTTAISGISAGVTTWNGRSGAVTLQWNDVSAVGGAPLASPAFTGSPTAPTATAGTATTQLATTQFVTSAISAIASGVTSFNTRTGVVTLTAADVTGVGGALLAGPAFTGVPTAPTATAGTNTTQLATTQFVTAAVAAAGGITGWTFALSGSQSTAVATGTTAPTVFRVGSAAAANTLNFQNAAQGIIAQIADNTSNAATVANYPILKDNTTGNPAILTTGGSDANRSIQLLPIGTGTVQAPTMTTTDSSVAVATTAFVKAAITAGTVTSFNTRTGAVTLTTADITNAGGAPAAGPTFTGTVTIPNPVAASNTTVAASTNWVRNYATGAFVPLAGGTMTGSLGISMTSPAIVLNAAAAGQYNALAGQVASKYRWVMNLGDGNAESGSNAGSNFLLSSYNDAGAGLLTPALTMTRMGDCNLTGALQINSTTADFAGGYPGLSLNKPAGTTTAWVGGFVNNLQRWEIDLGDGTAETGSNAGSNFVIANFTDAGAYINAALTINRATMNLTSLGPTASKPGGGSWTATSDERIKQVEGNYRAGLNELMALQPVLYRYRGNDTPEPPEGVVPFDNSPHRNVATEERQFVGLVAQEVETVLPECVIQRDGYIDGIPVTDLRSLDTGPLLFALINAVKDLAVQMQELREGREPPNPDEPRRKRRAA